MANGHIFKKRYYTICLMKYSIQMYRYVEKKTAYRALEVDKAVPLLRDPLMGRLTHPARHEDSKQYLRQEARLRDYSCQKPSQVEKD